MCRDTVMRSWRPIVVQFIYHHHFMFQHDNARPHVTWLWTQFLEAKNVPVLPGPAYSPDMSPIEHVWDALDQPCRQHVPVPANMQQLRTAIEEEWDNIPQATINSLINSMQRRIHTVWGKWWSHQILTSFLIHTTPYLKKKSCEIHRLGHNGFISIDWFPYMNCNSVKSLKLLRVALIFLLSVFYEVDGKKMDHLDMKQK